MLMSGFALLLVPASMFTDDHNHIIAKLSPRSSVFDLHPGCHLLDFLFQDLDQPLSIAAIGIKFSYCRFKRPQMGATRKAGRGGVSRNCLSGNVVGLNPQEGQAACDWLDVGCQ